MKDNASMLEPEQPSSRRSLLLAAGAAAGLAGAGLAWWRFTPQSVPGADQHAFWGQSFDTPQGLPLDMAAFAGTPLLVNFWATWCPPCVEELPLIDRFWRENAANGFQVLGLAIDQPSAVRKFLERQDLGFPMGLAGMGGTELAKSLGNAAGGLPFSVFFKADGSIWRQKLGQLNSGDLSEWLASRV
jgi:thiol-disulfide isomerase/thioredoxin